MNFYGNFNACTLRSAGRQRRVLWPFTAGVVLLVAGAPQFFGVGLILLAAWRMVLLVSDESQAKHAHGVHRTLSDSVRHEVLAIDAYCADLKASGANSAMAADFTKQIMQHTWAVVAAGESAPVEETARKLRTFRQQLPPIAQRQAHDERAGSDIASKIAEELNLVSVSRREVEAAL